MDRLRTSSSASSSSSPREIKPIKDDGAGFQRAVRSITDAVIADTQRLANGPFPHPAPHTMDSRSLQYENRRLRQELAAARRDLGEPYTRYLVTETPKVDVLGKESKSNFDSKQRLIQSLVMDLQRAEQENATIKNELTTLKVAYKRARRVIVKQRGIGGKLSGDALAQDRTSSRCKGTNAIVAPERNVWVEVLAVLEDFLHPHLPHDNSMVTLQRFIPVAEDGEIRETCIEKLQSIGDMIRESKAVRSPLCSTRAESDPSEGCEGKHEEITSIKC
eukprot:GEMP01028316.1.p1 GENE.GEMP01028316.1~~GEMP01028316.1.p1  ORF type:complete len:298 (+),score=64.35 GEMP01028316.1:68-895(+)